MPNDELPTLTAFHGGPVAVREVPCKTILNRSELFNYTLNCYGGCTHACAYCYARFMQRFHEHAEPWGDFVDVKINAVEVLKRQLRRASPGKVFLSSACDGWQPIEAHYRLTRRCCELLLEYGFQLHLLTKSPLVLRDFDLFVGHDVTIGATITTLDPEIAQLWEPGCCSPGLRWKILDEARRNQLASTVMAGPLLPELSDSPAALEALFESCSAHAVGAIYLDALNKRPRVWPAVADLLRRKFPELLPVYQRLLFDPQARNAYLDSLRGRIHTAKERTKVKASVHICF